MENIEEKAGVLHRVTSTHNRLRTDKMAGRFVDPPVLGRCFVIFGEPITEGTAGRLVHTSPVEAVVEEKPGCWRFDTANSSYRLIVVRPS